MEDFRGRSGSRQLRSNSASVRHKEWASRRSASEGGQPVRSPSSEKSSRTPSVSSMEVRCACQYFMTDSLLPEKGVHSPIHSPVRGRSPFHSPIRAVDLAPIRLGDHEYEPINPPPEPIPAPTYTNNVTPVIKTLDTKPPETKQADITLDKHAELFNGEKMLRIPLDSELVVPEDVKRSPSKERKQTPKPLDTPETSRAEDISTLSTSQVDSSALEHLPLKKESRKKTKAPKETSEEQPTMKEKFKTQTDKMKTKLKGIKKPSFAIPSKIQRPQFQRPKFQKPKINIPKIERPKIDTSKIKMPAMPKMPPMKMPPMPKMPKVNIPKVNTSQLSFPSFSLPRTKRQSQEDRTITTTESSVGSKPNIFDFRTYPRLFDRSKKAKMTEAEEVTSSGTDNPPIEIATVPRRKKGPVGMRWAKKFSDIHYADVEPKPTASELSDTQRADSLERRMEADLRFTEALEAEEEMREYERENQAIHQQADTKLPDRWSHGSFHRHDPEEPAQMELNGGPRELDDNQHSERSSVGSSGSRRRRGVLEEIDSDEFFLRQKGISQDNIQTQMYLNSEIREAFRQPVNALSQMSDVPKRYDSREFEMDGSDASIPKPHRPKRKHLKKTKKIKRTPHASHEKVTYDRESVNTEPEEYPKGYKPEIPKRGRKIKQLESEPSQEADESVVDDVPSAPIARHDSDNLSLPNIIGYVDKDINKEYERYLQDEDLMYENEMMKDKEQPEIMISGGAENGFPPYEIAQKDIDKFLEESGLTDTPKPPTRRHRSLRSLDISEHDSIIGEFNRDKLTDIPPQQISVFRVEHEYVTPTEDKSPEPPKRVRSRSRTSEFDDDRTSRGADSIMSDVQEQQRSPVELRDEMGYAIVDKSRKEPPPRPPTPRRSRSLGKKSPRMETKFFTTPRPLNDTPQRPTRNYSTLGPSRPPRKSSKSPVARKVEEEEDKENIDLTQYIEIDDEFVDHERLQSGEVISKMKDRPLPAPPRPPRKGRDFSKDGLRDITHEDNIPIDIDDYEKTFDISPASRTEAVEEIEVSTQTDPLPDDFVCEEVKEEPTDKIVAPRRRRRSTLDSTPERLDRPKTPLEGSVSPQVMIVERRVQTPTIDFDGQTTVTHASIVVKPVAEYPPDSYVSQRFSADIPDIMPQVLTQSSYPDEEEVLESEPTLKSIPTSDTLDKPLPDEEKQFEEKEPSPLPDYDAEYEKNKLESTEDDLVCDVISEQPPEIPEKPQRMKLRLQEESAPPVPPSPQPQIIERIIERPVPFSVTPGPDTEVEVLKAARLQVTDLDVERLNVTELQAQKILVSEIDGVSLQISELSSKTGSIMVNGLEIPTGLIQEILDKLQPLSQPPPPPPVVIREQVATQTSIEEEPKKETTKSKYESDKSDVQAETKPTESPEKAHEKTEPITQTELAETRPKEVEPIGHEQKQEKFEILEQKEQHTEQSKKIETIESIEHIPEIQKSESQSTETEIIETVQTEIKKQELATEPAKSEDKTDSFLGQTETNIEKTDVIETKVDQGETFLEQSDSFLRQTSEPAETSSLETQEKPAEQVPVTEKEDTKEETHETIPVDTETKTKQTTETVAQETIATEHTEQVSSHMTPKQEHTEAPKAHNISEQHKITKLTTELIDISESPLSFQAASIVETPQQPEPTSQDKKKREFSPETVGDVIETIEQLTSEEPLTPVESIETPPSECKRSDEELVKEAIDDILSGQINDLQKRIATLQEQMTLESMLDSEDEIVQDEPLSEFDESLIAEFPEEIKPHPTLTSIEETQPDITKDIAIEQELTKIDLETPIIQHQIKEELEKEVKEIKSPEKETVTEELKTELFAIKEEEVKAKDSTLDRFEVVKVKEDIEIPSKQEIPESEVSITKETSSKPDIPKPEPSSSQITTEIKKEDIPITKETVSKPETKKQDPKLQRTISQPTTVQETPPQNLMGSLAHSQVLHGLPYPVSYYPEMVHPVRTQDLSDEDIPVHHRRRRAQRQPSRSSSEEAPRTPSRRRMTRSPEPSVAQLTGQLVRASAVSLDRIIRHLLGYVSSHLTTPEGKQDLQIVMIIVLVLIAGLLLLGFGGGKTVHLHHWEFFNPPKEL